MIFHVLNRFWEQLFIDTLIIYVLYKVIVWEIMRTFPSPKCKSFCGMISKSSHIFLDRNYMWVMHVGIMATLFRGIKIKLNFKEIYSGIILDFIRLFYVYISWDVTACPDPGQSHIVKGDISLNSKELFETKVFFIWCDLVETSPSYNNFIHTFKELSWVRIRSKLYFP